MALWVVYVAVQTAVVVSILTRNEDNLCCNSCKVYSPIMDLTKETILITGVAGFVGASLTRRLVAQGVKPHVLVPAKSNLWRIADIGRDIVIHENDLTEPDTIRVSIQKIRPTIVYHLAAHGAYSSQIDARRIMEVNVMGTLNLLQALEGIDYKLMVNTGTSSEYGFKDHPMREADFPVPNSYYAVSKISQTLICQYVAASQKKNIVTFRLFSVYGPYEEPARLVPTLIRSCLSGKDLNMVSPQTARDFIYVDDVVDAYLMVDALLKQGGEIFNIGSGRQSTIRQITEQAIALTSARVQVHWNAMSSRIWDASTWVGDVRKAKQILGFTARTSLPEGLAQTIAWIKNHG